MIRILLICIFFINCKQEIKNINVNAQTSQDEETVESIFFDLTGNWKYEKTSSSSDIPEEFFTINIEQKNGAIEGKYCAIARFGRKIDCEPDDEKNIEGKQKGEKFIVEFYSFFGNKNDLGQAEISIIDERTIKWKVIKTPKSECYVPFECFLTRENNKIDDSSKKRINSIVSKNQKLPYNKTINITEVSYDEINSTVIRGIEEFSCGEINVRYIPMLKKGNVDAILVPQDCGDFPYRFYLLSIKNNKVISNLYVEGEWNEPENDDISEKTSFTIDENFIITVKTINKNLDNGVNEEKKYKIVDTGEIVE